MTTGEPLSAESFDHTTVRIGHDDDDKQLREQLEAYAVKHRYTRKSDVYRDLVRQALAKPQDIENTLKETSEELFQLRAEILELKANIGDRTGRQGTDPDTTERLDGLMQEIRSLREDINAFKRLRGELALAVGSILSMQGTLTQEEAQEYVKRAFPEI